MSSGTMHQSGFVAGAARPGSCAAHPIAAGIHALSHARMWLDGSYVKPTLRVFATNRPVPRPLERSP